MGMLSITKRKKVRCRVAWTWAGSWIVEYVKFVDKEQHKTKRRQKEEGFDIDVLRSAAELIRMLLIIGISTFLGMLSILTKQVRVRGGECGGLGGNYASGLIGHRWVK